MDTPIVISSNPHTRREALRELNIVIRPAKIRPAAQTVPQNTCQLSNLIISRFFSNRTPPNAAIVTPKNALTRKFFFIPPIMTYQSQLVNYRFRRFFTRTITRQTAAITMAIAPIIIAQAAGVGQKNNSIGSTFFVVKSAEFLLTPHSPAFLL